MAAVITAADDGSFDDVTPGIVIDWLLWQADLARPRTSTPPADDPSWTRKARLDYHSEFATLTTPFMERAATELRMTLLVNNRQRSTARHGLIVSGPPGAGKSTTLAELGRSFELSERRRLAGYQGAIMPVAFAAIPPTYAPKSLVQVLARFAGIPVYDRMTETTITNAVCHALCERRNRLVFMDDVHLLHTRTRPGADTSDQLKTLAERIPATFVLAGVDAENSPLLTGPCGAQLAARCKLLCTSPLLNGTAQQKEIWRRLLGDMELALRLPRHRPGTLVRHADYIHLRTGGVLASLSLLVREPRSDPSWTGASRSPNGSCPRWCSTSRQRTRSSRAADATRAASRNRGHTPARSGARPGVWPRTGHLLPCPGPSTQCVQVTAAQGRAGHGCTSPSPLLLYLL